MNVQRSSPFDLCVLLLGDNVENATLLKCALTSVGYNPRVDVTDSREGFLKKLCPEYDVIISDDEMQHLDAFHALDLAARSHPEIPFLIVSGTPTEENAREAMRRGAADYLSKDGLAGLDAAIARTLELRRQRVEKEKLTTELRRLSAAVESAGDAIVITSSDGRHLFHNAAAERLSGYTSDELRGQKGCSAFFADEQCAREVTAVLLAGRSWSGQVELKRRDGIVLPTFLRVDAITDRDGNADGLVCRFRDISDEKHYEEQLIRVHREANQLARMKSLFLTTMSHEFRTPLTGILGFAELLETTVSKEDREFVSHIYTSGTRLLQTLNTVLQLAQIESGQAKLQLHRLNVTREIERIVERYRSEAATAGLQISCIVPEHTYAVADTDAFELVLGKLLSNAIKFTERGQITVEVRTGERGVQIDVTDTGVGIGAEFLPHVFDEFKQESAGESRHFEGTGIGLTVAKAFVELMGGCISAKSRRGSGSTFTVTLEQAEQPVSKAAVSELLRADPDSRATTGKMSCDAAFFAESNLSAGIT